MTLANEFLRGINAIYTKAGVSATYTDADDVASSVTVIVESDLSVYGDTAEVAQATASVSVRVSEVQYIPRRGDTFVVGSTTYIVSDALRSDELEHTVLVA